MLVTTTNSIEGRPVQQYKGVVFGEIVAGVNFVKDFVAGLSDIFGGRSGTYEEELINARNGAMQEMIDRAEQMGANAIVGMNLDYEVLGSSMLMVTASGTAVVIA